MTTFTDKELIKEIRERIGSLDVRDNIERLAYEIALASLEAEPVSQTYKLNQISGNYPVTPDGWISCSDRMPDNNHDVLFFDVWGYIRIGWFSADDWSWFTSDDGCCMEVTHWMPLPEPPQEVK
ncbi:DUF551 domain-containing protein [Escherichia coli]